MSSGVFSQDRKEAELEDHLTKVLVHITTLKNTYRATERSKGSRPMSLWSGKGSTYCLTTSKTKFELQTSFIQLSFSSFVISFPRSPIDSITHLFVCPFINPSAHQNPPDHRPWLWMATISLQKSTPSSISWGCGTLCFVSLPKRSARPTLPSWLSYLVQTTLSTGSFSDRASRTMNFHNYGETVSSPELDDIHVHRMNP